MNVCVCVCVCKKEKERERETERERERERHLLHVIYLTISLLCLLTRRGVFHRTTVAFQSRFIVRLSAHVKRTQPLLVTLPSDVCGLRP